MANQIIFSANIVPATTPMEVSTNGGTSFVALTFTTVGSVQQATLTGVVAATYAAGQLVMRAVGYGSTTTQPSQGQVIVAAAGPRLVIVFGNSVHWGQSTASYPERARTGALASRISFPEVMADGLLSSNVKVLGYGYPGQRTDQLNAYIATAITPNLDFVTYSTITVCLGELLNSVQQGRTFAQTQTDMNALIAAVRAVDSRIKIDFLSATPWLTLVNSGDATLIQLNNYYKSVVGSTVDRFIDTRSVPVIGNFTTGYFFDDVHPNAYGYYAMAALGVKAYLPANYTTTVIAMPEYLPVTTAGPSFTTQDDVANTATFGAGGFAATDLIYSIDNGTTLTILPAADLASNVITIPVGNVALAAGAVRVFKKYRYDFLPISPMAVTSAAFTIAPVGAVTWTNLFHASVVGDELRYDGLSGWGSAGASSVQKITAPTATAFTSVSVILPVVQAQYFVGLSTTDPDQAYQTEQYAVFCNNGSINAWQSGADKGVVGTFVANDKLTLEMQPTGYQVRVNGVALGALQAFVVAPTYPLLVDIAFNGGGLAIIKTATLVSN